MHSDALSPRRVSDMWHWHLYWKQCRQTTTQSKGIGVPLWTAWKTWTSPSKGTPINARSFSVSFRIRHGKARARLISWRFCPPPQTRDGAEFRPGQWKQHPRDDEGAAVLPGLVRPGVQSRLRVRSLSGCWEVRLRGLSWLLGGLRVMIKLISFAATLVGKLLSISKLLAPSKPVMRTWRKD